MTTVDYIKELFCRVDDRMPMQPKHPQARLYPSELATIGLLFAIKGVVIVHFTAGLPVITVDYFQTS